MKGYINGIDWLNAEAMKYWSFTAATEQEKRRRIVHDAIFSGDYIGALKVDGYYQRLLKDEDGNCFMIARSRDVHGDIVNKIEWLPHMKEWWDSLPNGTCLLAECYWPGNEGSKNITTILGCLKEKAIQRQKDHPLHFYIFDVMAYSGCNCDKMGYERRMRAVQELSQTYQSPYVEWAQYYEGQELWSHLQDYLAEGREGMVIMRKDAPVYFKRTPAKVSIKVKKELQDTIDVVIIGANAPTREYGGKEITTWRYWEDEVSGEKLCGEYYKDYSDGKPISPVTKAYFNGWAGSLRIGMRKDDKVVEVGSLSGITEEVLSNWKEYVGKVAEITAMQIMDTGGLRHPKFLSWRPDKRASDTDWYAVFGK